MYNLEPGTVTGAPQVTQDLVYILVASKPHVPLPHGPEYNQYYYIFALDRKSGAVRWSTHYFADSSQMSVAPDGSMVYVTDANELMAFNGENGQRQWVKQVSRHNTDGGFFALQFANETLYATLSYYGSTHTSLVYAFDAARGSQLWVSQPVDGLISPVVVDQNAVYFGSEAGHVYALRASDGSQLWNYSNGPFEAYVSLQKKDGLIYARVTQSTYGRATEIIGKAPVLSLAVLDANSGTFERGTTIPPTHDNFGTAVGWDGGQLVVGNDIVYTSMKNGEVCSLSIQQLSFIECDTITHSAIAPTLTLVEDAAN
jgi:outer membrane protein assembly factor BamB